MPGQGAEKYFFYIKQNVADRWKDLAYWLGFEDPAIRNIEGRNRDDRSRCMDLLQEWKRTKGNAATTGVLMKALADAGLHDVLDGLKTQFPELATQQVTARQETGGQPQHGTSRQRHQNTKEQPSSPQDTTQPTQETGDQTSSDSSWSEPQQETSGPSSTGGPYCTSKEGPKKLFIVHGGEDKDTLVDPLAHEIVDQGVPMENVFYDKWSIGYTQGIKQSITSASQDSSCKLAVIVLSKEMMKKYWPRKEFEEFLMRRISFFPIFYGVTPEEVRKDYSPTLADTRGKVITKTGNRVDDNTIAGTASNIRKTLRDL